MKLPAADTADNAAASADMSAAKDASSEGWKFIINRLLGEG